MAIQNDTPPSVSYGSGPTVLTWTYPVKPWQGKRGGVGGLEWSATDVPASYSVVRHGDLAVTLRVLESELANTLTWIEAVQSPMLAFDFALDGITSVECYLLSPACGEEVQQNRSDFGPLLEIPIVLRRTDGAAWTTAYFA